MQLSHSSTINSLQGIVKFRKLRILLKKILLSLTPQSFSVTAVTAVTAITTITATTILVLILMNNLRYCLNETLVHNDLF